MWPDVEIKNSPILFPKVALKVATVVFTWKAMFSSCLKRHQTFEPLLREKLTQIILSNRQIWLHWTCCYSMPPLLFAAFASIDKTMTTTNRLNWLFKKPQIPGTEQILRLSTKPYYTLGGAGRLAVNALPTIMKEEFELTLNKTISLNPMALVVPFITHWFLRASVPILYYLFTYSSESFQINFAVKTFNISWVKFWKKSSALHLLINE